MKKNLIIQEDPQNINMLLASKKAFGDAKITKKIQKNKLLISLLSQHEKTLRAHEADIHQTEHIYQKIKAITHE